MTRETRPKKSTKPTLVLDKDARAKLSGVELKAPCPKCGKVQDVFVCEAAVGRRSTVQVDCFDKYEPVLSVFEVGDYVRFKHDQNKPCWQITEISECGHFGADPWSPPRTYWGNHQLEHVSPSKRPPPPCKNKWKIEVQLDLTIKQSS